VKADLLREVEAYRFGSRWGR